MNLRPYQRDAVTAIFREWESNQSTLIVLPTGTGKTVVFSSVIQEALAKWGGRAIVIAHREELIWQACNKIRAVTGIQPAVEMADYRADTGMFERASVVVSTVQTLNAGRAGPRMERFDPRQFSCLIFDESHHATANSWRSVLDHFCSNPKLRVLGVTATPDRADEAALGQVFESVAFDYGVMDAVRDGWLVPIQQRMVTVSSLDLSSVHTQGGDLNGAELAEVMEAEQNLHEIATPTIELVGDRKTLVFAASVAHAERLCEIFNRHKGGCADWVCGATPKDKRRELLARFAEGRIQIICNVGVLTEGFDDPAVEVVVMGRPTKSRSLYAQMAGRATRPLPGIVDRWELAEDRRVAIGESEKPWCEIIDFVGNAGKHKLVSTADILGGEYDDEVVERAAKKAETSNDPVDMARALEQSMDEIRAEKEAEQRREAARRARLRVGAQYATQAVDPFDVLDIKPKREMGWDTGKPISDKMKNLLEKQGITTDGISYAHARQLINEMFRRWDSGQCTFKQAKLLKRYGLPTDVSKAEASDWFEKIRANQWRLPAELQGHVKSPTPSRAPAAVSTSDLPAEVF